ncbi:MAG: hypothetical protein ACP5IB_06795 [Thermoplasmata archaeon]
MIDLRPLKKVVQQKKGFLLAEIIEKEPDFISEIEYLAKIPIWLELLEKKE